MSQNDWSYSMCEVFNWKEIRNVQPNVLQIAVLWAAEEGKKKAAKKFISSKYYNIATNQFLAAEMSLLWTLIAQTPVARRRNKNYQAKLDWTVARIW